MKIKFILIILLVLIRINTYSQKRSGWLDVSPYPKYTVNLLGSIYFINKDTIFIKGMITSLGKSFIFVTHDGMNWEKKHDFGGGTWFFLNHDYGIQLSGRRIYTITHDGDSISQIYDFGQFISGGLYFDFAKNFYVPHLYSQYSNKTLISKDFGVDWDTLCDTILNDMIFFKNSIGTASVSIWGNFTNKYAITSDSSKTWKIFLNRNTNNCRFITPDTGFAILGSFNLVKTINAGETWDTLNKMFPSLVHSFDFLDSKTGFATVDNNGVYYTINSGKSWRLLSNNYSNISYFTNIKSFKTGSQVMLYLYGINQAGLIKILKSVWDSTEIWLGENIQSANNPFNFEIYPNPASDMINLEWKNLKSEGNCQLTIVNMVGEITYQSSINYREASIIINVENWAKGIYIVTFRNGDSIFRKKLVIK